MQSSNRFAFKEWAVVCAALAEGRQSLILRKGGIHEGRAGFRVEHDEFWLFPTAFHQNPDDVTEEAQVLWKRVAGEEPAPGTIALQDYAVVDEVILIDDEVLLPRLHGLHIWSHRTLDQRFHYRRPGLFALLLRIYRRPEPLILPDSPHFAGCRSWVDLPEDLPVEGLEPVLNDDEHKDHLDAIRAALTRSMPG